MRGDRMTVETIDGLSRPSRRRCERSSRGSGARSEGNARGARNHQLTNTDVQAERHHLIYFAGFKRHIGLDSVSVDGNEFSKELAPYATGKATLQFPLDRPIPFGLITKVLKFKVTQSRQAALKKRKDQTKVSTMNDRKARNPRDCRHGRFHGLLPSRKPYPPARPRLRRPMVRNNCTHP